MAMTTPHHPTPAQVDPGQDSIELARRTMLRDHSPLPTNTVAPWVERSWTRCLQLGLQTSEAITFNQVPLAHMRHTQEAHQQLIKSAKPILESLARAIVNTRYFAILTNAQGIVIDASGAIDRSDSRADLITRIGTDLSEPSIGTTAIGTALSELQPVWLHRGEHFFEATSVYSCAGAPLFGPYGECVGMLDVTGVDVQERPELKHLVRQSACKIENALIITQRHSLLLRLNWPGNVLGSDADGILCLDADGWINGANRAARQMVPGLNRPDLAAVHVSEVFGLPIEQLFDASKHPIRMMELGLWSGLRLQAQVVAQADENKTMQAGPQAPPALALREVEAAMIRKAIDEARGNVGQAARVLGISRATLYRKLGNHTHRQDL